MDNFGPHFPSPQNTLHLLVALINGLLLQFSALPQSSALPPMLPAVWSLHRVPAWPQLSTVGLVGRARNPSKLTCVVYLFRLWPFLPTSKRRKADAKEPGSVQAAAALPMWKQPLAMRIYLSANSKRRPVGLTGPKLVHPWCQLSSPLLHPRLRPLILSP